MPEETAPPALLRVLMEVSKVNDFHFKHTFTASAMPERKLKEKVSFMSWVYLQSVSRNPVLWLKEPYNEPQTGTFPWSLTPARLHLEGGFKGRSAGFIHQPTNAWRWTGKAHPNVEVLQHARARRWTAFKSKYCTDAITPTRNPTLSARVCLSWALPVLRSLFSPNGQTCLVRFWSH